MGLSGAATIICGGEETLHDKNHAELQSEHMPLLFAAKFSIKEVIDPAETRDLVVRTLRPTPHAIKTDRRCPIGPW